MNQHIENVFIEMKEKRQKVLDLKAIDHQERPKLTKLLDQQEKGFDFKREEQIQNKQSALSKLDGQIKQHSEAYDNGLEGKRLRLNSQIRNDKLRLIEQDESVLDGRQRILDAEQALKEAKEALQASIQAFDDSYNEELNALGNDVIHFRIDR